MILERPDLVQKMVKAILYGWKEALANKEATVDLILSMDSKLDRVHEMKMIDSVEKLTLTSDINDKIGWMTTEQWMKMIQLWKKHKGIKKEVTPEECFDASFVKNIYQEAK